MPFGKISLCLLLLFCTGISLASNRVCVLNFERVAHPYTKMIDSVLGGHKNIRVIHEATPKDFLNCVLDDFSEIMIVAHALQMDKTRAHYNLGYFKKRSAPQDDGSRNPPVGLPVYDLYPILPRIFEQTLDFARSSQLNLRRLRIASCVPGKVLSNYPALKELINENQIQLEWGPKSFLAGLLVLEGSGILTKKWLKKSICNPCN